MTDHRGRTFRPRACLIGKQSQGRRRYVQKCLHGDVVSRGNGWRGMGLVVWSHEPNRSALLAFHELYLAAQSIGETAEVDRLRTLLLESDPSDPLGVGGAG